MPSARRSRAAMGSSPLARGPPFWYGGGASAAGLIPARAGTTREGFSSKTCSRAHPRSRGDHPLLAGRGGGAVGSSPLARGPRGGRSAANHRPGLIPARAGTTLCKLDSLKPERAHPRSRGDHLFCACGKCCLWGSSPLARGPHPRTEQPAYPPGLIPARAGTTSMHGTPPPLSGAHPRSRGDH